MLELEDVLDYVDRCVFDYANRHLTEIEKGIIRWSYEGLSYKEMAVQMGYSQNTVRAVYGYQLWKFLKQVWPGENITKTNFLSTVERLWKKEQDVLINGTQQDRPPESISQDLNPGRLDELDSNPQETPLLRLVSALQSGCQAIVLTGAKGIGKSYLLDNLPLVLNGHFTEIIYHPLNEIPTWKTWYQTLSSLGLIDFLNGSDKDMPGAVSQMRQQVLRTLNQNRYLLIVEHGEQFIDNPDYKAFFGEIATTLDHQSCLLWVSAIQPTDIDRRIPTEKLQGLSFDEASALLPQEYPYLRDSLAQHEIHWKQLVKLCGGNPALLHKSIETLKSFYANQIQQFTANLSSLPLLSDRHLERLTDELSDAEQALLYLFALRPLSWLDVQAWLPVSTLKNTQLVQAWDMLHRRHLLEYFSETHGICQITPPYLGLYLLQQLKEIFLKELIDETLTLFHIYPLSLPTVSVKQQETLKNYLLVPIANTLKYRFLSEDLAAKFSRLISQLHTLPVSSRSYAAGNLFNLATYLGLSLADVSWANLTLWHADLRVSRLQGLDFQGCRFREAVLMMGTYESCAIALHPDKTAMAIGDSQGFLQVYQWVNNRFILAWCDELEIPIQQIVVTDSNTLIVILIDQSIVIWDSLTHKEQCYSDISGIATICSVDLTDDLLAIGLGNREIQLWNLMLGEEIGESLCEANDIVRHLAFNPDASILAGYDNNSSILIWYHNTSTNDYTIAEAPLPLNPYGDFLVFQWFGDQLNVVETVADDASNQHLYKAIMRCFTVTDPILAEDSISFKVKELNTNLRQPYQATFSNNGRYLALCDIDHTVWVWNEMMSLLALITLPELPEQFFISNDGQQLLCQNKSTVSIWDLQVEEILQTWKTVSDLDQYQNCKFYTKQGFSNEELYAVQRLQGIVVD